MSKAVFPKEKKLMVFFFPGMLIKMWYSESVIPVNYDNSVCCGGFAGKVS